MNKISMKTSNIKTNEGLAVFAKAQVGAPYWFGTFGQKSSRKLYKAKKKQYPKEYEWKYKNKQPGVFPAKQRGVCVFDCSGLIKGYLWTKEDGTIRYNASQDLPVSRLFELSPLSGTIETMPEKIGVLVFASNHVGVYIGNGKVIDAKGHAMGVIETRLKDRAFTHWGYCPWIQYL